MVSCTLRDGERRIEDVYKLIGQAWWAEGGLVGFLRGQSSVDWERFKGAWYWHGTAVIPGDVVCEGGWGVNSYYIFDDDLNEHGNIRYYNPGTGFTSDMRRLSREDAIIHPLFTPFRAEAGAMHSTNLFTIADAKKSYELRARFLGDAIPAESFAMGANKVDKRNSGIDNLSMMEKCMANEEFWPRKDEQTKAKLWHHSDWKQLAGFWRGQSLVDPTFCYISLVRIFRGQSLRFPPVFSGDCPSGLPPGGPRLSRPYVRVQLLGGQSPVLAGTVPLQTGGDSPSENP